MFYFWLTIVLFLTIVEISTVNLVSIWFVISGIFSMLLALVIDSFTIQLTVFVVLGIILLISTKSVIKKMQPKKEKTNLDRIIGTNAVVTQTINKNSPGEVKVEGVLWTATADELIEKGSIVKILEINSTKLRVEKEEE